MLSLAAAAYDWKSGHIPNYLTFGGLAVGVVIRFVEASRHHGSLAAEAGSVAVGFVVCSLVPILLVRWNAIGFGDVKLFGVIGAILGWQAGIGTQFNAFLVASFLAPARLAYEGTLFRTLKNVGWIMTNAFLPKHKRVVIAPEAMSWFRLGPAICAGTVLTALLNWRS